MSNFIVDNTALPTVKSDLIPVSVGFEDKSVAASDLNGYRTIVSDIRDWARGNVANFSIFKNNASPPATAAGKVVAYSDGGWLKIRGASLAYGLDVRSFKVTQDGSPYADTILFSVAGDGSGVTISPDGGPLAANGGATISNFFNAPDGATIPAIFGGTNFDGITLGGAPLAQATLGWISVKDQGAVGDGTTDDTAAIAAAVSLAASVGGCVFFPAGTYKITSQITVDDSAKITLRGAGPKSIIKKFFNGDMISLGAMSTLTELYLDGNGASYTGRGVVISTGDNDQVSWRRIERCTIRNTASYCIEFTASRAGFASQVSDTQLSVYNNTTYAIKLPTDVTNGNRQFLNVVAISGSLIDLGGSENTLVMGCQSGGAVANDGIKFGASTVKARVIGNRFATGSATTLRGTECAVIGNVFAYDVVVGSDLLNSVVKGNQITSGRTITDPNVTTNHLDWMEFQSYTPVWTTTGTAPSLGNGLLAGNYQRNGRTITAWIEFTAGSTTTFGTGTWLITLPTATNNGRGFIGNVVIQKSGGNLYQGYVVQWAPGDARLILFQGNSGVTGTAPFAFAAGDSIKITVTYSI